MWLEVDIQSTKHYGDICVHVCVKLRVNVYHSHFDQHQLSLISHLLVLEEHRESFILVVVKYGKRIQSNFNIRHTLRLLKDHVEPLYLRSELPRLKLLLRSEQGAQTAVPSRKTFVLRVSDYRETQSFRVEGEAEVCSFLE